MEPDSRSRVRQGPIPQPFCGWTCGGTAGSAHGPAELRRRLPPRCGAVGRPGFSRPPGARDVARPSGAARPPRRETPLRVVCAGGGGGRRRCGRGLFPRGDHVHPGAAQADARLQEVSRTPAWRRAGTPPGGRSRRRPGSGGSVARPWAWPGRLRGSGSGSGSSGPGKPSPRAAARSCTGAACPGPSLRPRSFVPGGLAPSPRFPGLPSLGAAGPERSEPAASPIALSGSGAGRGSRGSCPAGPALCRPPRPCVDGWGRLRIKVEAEPPKQGQGPAARTGRARGRGASPRAVGRGLRWVSGQVWVSGGALALGARRCGAGCSCRAPRCSRSSHKLWPGVPKGPGSAGAWGLLGWRALKTGAIRDGHRKMKREELANAWFVCM